MDDVLQKLDEFDGSLINPIFSVFLRVGMFDLSGGSGRPDESDSCSVSDFPPSGWGYQKTESAVTIRRTNDWPGRFLFPKGDDPGKFGILNISLQTVKAGFGVPDMARLSTASN